MRKAEEMGVEIPKYLKPGAINPLSYAEQVQKRKMLWKKSDPSESKQESKVTVANSDTHTKKSDNNKDTSTAAVSKTSFNKWEATNFGNDVANEKFRRLMGIKAAAKPEAYKTDDAPGKDSEKIMGDLARNYEVARQQTHRNRGIGLGFSNSCDIMQV